jgi:hypothetical protein
MENEMAHHLLNIALKSCATPQRDFTILKLFKVSFIAPLMNFASFVEKQELCQLYVCVKYCVKAMMTIVSWGIAEI